MTITAHVGRALVMLVAAILLIDGLLQIGSPPPMVQALAHIGFAPDSGPMIAVATLSCALLLAVPRTAPIGAVLTTGFLGGAICAHLRIGDMGSPPQLIALLLGGASWLGLLLGDPRVRQLVQAP
jgi:hypothetical protein